MRVYFTQFWEKKSELRVCITQLWEKKVRFVNERAGVLLAAVLIYLHLMLNTFVWLYFMLFRRHINDGNWLALLSCSTRGFWMRVRNRDWWQRVVFSPEMWCFLPTIISNYYSNYSILFQVPVTSFMYVTSTYTLWSKRLLRLRCLHVCIFRLKSAYANYINMIMLAAIVSLIALFKLKYCVYMR